MNNQTINCNVENCKWNNHKKTCQLQSIQVSCGCEDCTCCATFEEV